MVGLFQSLPTARVGLARILTRDPLHIRWGIHAIHLHARAQIELDGLENDLRAERINLLWCGQVRHVFSGVMVSGHTGDLTGDGLLHKCPTTLFFGAGLSEFFRAGRQP